MNEKLYNLFDNAVDKTVKVFATEVVDFGSILGLFRPTISKFQFSCLTFFVKAKKLLFPQTGLECC